MTTMDTSRDGIATWCQSYLAGLLEVQPDSLGLDTDFGKLGVDSALAVSLLMEVEERYDVDLSPETLFENPNLNAVAGYLHEQLRQRVARS